jgi:hypothetical protein
MGGYNSLTWEEKDPNPPHGIIRSCHQDFWRSTIGNTNIYFHGNCVVDIDDHIGHLHYPMVTVKPISVQIVKPK